MHTATGIGILGEKLAATWQRCRDNAHNHHHKKHHDDDEPHHHKHHDDDDYETYDYDDDEGDDDVEEDDDGKIPLAFMSESCPVLSVKALSQSIIPFSSLLNISRQHS